MKYKDTNVEFSSKIEDIPNFSAHNSAAICCIVADGKILLVKKNPERFKHNSYWGFPGGKLESGETAEQALLREIFEETNLRLDLNEIFLVNKLHVRISIMDYELYVFMANIPFKPEDLPVKIDNIEHCEFSWVTPQQAIEYNLMFGGNEIIRSIF